MIKTLPVLLASLVCLTPAVAQEVAIIKGTISAPAGPERNMSTRVAERIGSWLADLNIPFQSLTDEDVVAGRLSSIKVAILGYNPTPPASELRQLKAFTRKGGKLIVCYSSSDALATAMGLRLGAYKANRKNGGWSSFRFHDGPMDLPEAVFQTSWNIRPAHPATGQAKVIAWWYDARNKKLTDPAWVKSKQGYWMSHILLLDDTENKKTMLLSMLADSLPALWKPAARAYTGNWLRVGRYPTPDAAMSAIQRSSPNDPIIKLLLDDANDQQSAMRSAVASEKYREAIQHARKLKAILTQAFARTVPNRPNEIRGIWDHTGMGLYPGGWDATCRTLKQNGINTVFPNLMWSTFAHYKSSVLPPSKDYLTYGDQLEACLTAARKYGLKVHVWKVCWSLKDAPPELKEELRKQNRIQVTNTGKALDWLCPSDPKNHKMELAGIAEMASKPIDGIQLDYIRYRDSSNCFCKGCHKRFQRDTGITIQNWPRGARSGPHAKTYNTWRVGNITRFVTETRKTMKAINPKLQLSAAVFGSYPACVHSVAQDWASWIEAGLVDFVCPMNYTPDVETFEKWVTEQHALKRAKGRVVPGIGIRAKESYLDPVDTLEQLKVVRKLGAPGYVLFELRSDVPREILDVMSIRATRPTQP